MLPQMESVGENATKKKIEHSEQIMVGNTPRQSLRDILKRKEFDMS